jgi:hypothetical protein
MGLNVAYLHHAALGRAEFLVVTIPGHDKDFFLDPALTRTFSWQMRELNRVYRIIDKIVEHDQNVYTVENVGPEYLCSVGVCVRHTLPKLPLLYPSPKRAEEFLLAG